MKTKLLRKLRNESRKVYCIKSHIETSNGVGVWIIGLREPSTKFDAAEFKLEDAHKTLRRMRNSYCVNRIDEMRSSMCVRRYCRV